MLDAHTHTCGSFGGIFETSAKMCSSRTVANGRFSSFLSTAPTLNTLLASPVNLAQGYNLISTSALGIGSNFLLKPGQMLQLDFSTAVVALDRSPSLNSLSDFLIGSPYTRLNATDSWRLFVRLVTSTSEKSISLFKNYTKQGNYSITTSLLTSKNGLESANQTFVSLVQIEDGIQGLGANMLNNFSSQIQAPSCVLNVGCLLTSSIKTGSNVNYVWTFSYQNGPIANSGLSNITFTTLLNSSVFTFTNVGDYVVNLTAYNSISRKFIIFYMSVYDVSTGVKLYSGNAAQSASIVQKSAAFLFQINSSNFYTCSVDFGDNT